MARRNRRGRRDKVDCSYCNSSLVCTFSLSSQTHEMVIRASPNNAPPSSGIQKRPTMTIYADASLEGFGFWSPQVKRGYHGDLPRSPLLDDINFMEFYAVASAISWASKRLDPGDYLLVFTDSKNTVDKFDGGRMEWEYYGLKAEVDTLVDDADIRISVKHIPRNQNRIADRLSRPNPSLEYIHNLEPDLEIHRYNVSKRLKRSAGHSYSQTCHNPPPPPLPCPCTFPYSYPCPCPTHRWIPEAMGHGLPATGGTFEGVEAVWWTQICAGMGYDRFA
ncbi:hypothetical protein SCHPADRAFT_863196 [Schizopora paradoxa]|uniref:Uncharacterized protein n=1 Tax=Schizopora paradoxa TaxID=27342 RepID=A0A0H2STM3_9AGAM|nr:hypothetical protein SCHPADRAFT_863196 [Schizopora paradoxa]